MQRVFVLTLTRKEVGEERFLSGLITESQEIKDIDVIPTSQMHSSGKPSF